MTETADPQQQRENPLLEGLRVRRTPDPCALVIFGASGDLTRRKLFPALYSLALRRLLPEQFAVVGVARSEESDDEFRERMKHAVQEFGRDEFKEDVWDWLAEGMRYVATDFADEGGEDRVRDVLNELDEQRKTAGNRVYYLAVPPDAIATLLQEIGERRSTEGWTRVIVEKPFGRDLATAQELNAEIGKYFAENEIFRIDHYLGKETVQNLLALRFANSMFEPLWNSAHIDHVQITVAETIGLEGRGDYYDQAGALRDMVQNHMLQLLALVAMEPPTDFNATAVRDEKVKVLRALRPIGSEDIEADSVTGQYTRGAIDGETVPGYDDEIGRDSSTETFVALKAHIDNWRWKGVPFYLRTGKRMPERDTEIFIQFRDVPYSIFASRGATTKPNKLIIGLQPEESIELRLMSKTPGLDRQGVRLREIPLDIGLANAFSEYRRRIAYERLLLDLIEGDPTLFVRRDEVEAQWAWIDRIRAAWAEKGMTPRPYAAGTWGPSAAIALTERDGISWHE